jgi:hypothetical protein
MGSKWVQQPLFAHHRNTASAVLFLQFHPATALEVVLILPHAASAIGSLDITSGDGGRRSESWLVVGDSR